MTVADVNWCTIGHRARISRPEGSRTGCRSRRKGDEEVTCYRCGGKHTADSCNFRDVECFSCGVKGHLAHMCRRRERSRAGGGAQAYRLAEESERQEAEDGLLGEYSLF